MAGTKSRKFVAFAGLLWITTVLLGLHWLLTYKAIPGQIGQTTVGWPKDTSLALNRTQPTLIVFVHPRCPCSRATLSELENIMAHAQKPVAVQMAFFQPSNEAKAWAETELYRKAKRLKGVEVVMDPDGREANRFGAVTSGHAVLFSPKGELLFYGGITGSRGHAGENAGELSVLNTINGDRVAYARTSVFGCPIQAQ